MKYMTNIDTRDRLFGLHAHVTKSWQKLAYHLAFTRSVSAKYSMMYFLNA